jgi:SAM-dependent methyltransferase
MTSTAEQNTGSASKWGVLWGSRATDWAANEERQEPTYREAIRRAGVSAGQRVLDVGCGSGVFLRLAADQGAEVFGIDASGELLAIAGERVPEADLRTGEMEALPYDDGSFDLVTGFNAFFFATDMVAALREAGRVARPRATIVIQVWGDPDRTDIEKMKAVVRPFMPPRPPDAPEPPPLWKPGVLEQLAERAGLEPESALDISYAFSYPDSETLGRLMMAPAGVAELVGPEREPQVREEVVAALAGCRQPDGSYRLENEFRFLIARA